MAVEDQAIDDTAEQEVVARPEVTNSPLEDSKPEEELAGSEPEELAGVDVQAQWEEKIHTLQTEINDLKDTYLRKQADMDNYRKRIIREKEEAVSYANRQLLLDIVGIIDDFDRAIQSSESAKDFTSFHDGIVMIKKQFSDMLERKWQVSGFGEEGEEFDPEKHEALMVGESAESASQVVLQVLQRGYLLKSSVLRAAKVKVSLPASAEKEESK